MADGLLVDRRFGDIWQILKVWREIQPHLNTVLDESQPWEKRIECGLHILQIAAKLTPTEVDDDLLAWLDETELDETLIKLIADIIEKFDNDEAVPILVGAEPVEGVPVVLIIQVAIMLYNLFFKK